MTRTPATPDTTAAAHARLTARIAEALDQGQAVPCITSEHREDWTAGEGTPTGRKALARAANDCLQCPLLDPCRDYGLAHEPAGTWGAMTPSERRNTPTAHHDDQASVDELDDTLADALHRLTA